MTKREAGGPATIIDVAREAQVSIKTVSRVVNAEPGVHEETLKRVKEAIERLQYRPKLSARALAGARSFIVGLFYFDEQSAFIGNLQRGATQTCRELGYHLIVEPLQASATDLVSHVERSLSALRPDGVILAPPLCDHAEVLQAMQRQGTRIVKLSPRELQGSCIGIDDVQAARELTQLLLDAGHQRIGFLQGPPDQIASQRRQQGFSAALRAARRKAAWVWPGDFTFQSGVAAARIWQDQPNRPSAVFSANDDMALGLMAEARRLGHQVPEALSVVGFDDAPAASMVWPGLTTVRQPLEDMAARAVHLLVGQNTQPCRIVMPHRLMLRQSVQERAEA
ncbi:MAG: LacI family DNA-binding transcriptional regulator [Burkholderiales bacterium]|nr:LacI family DNA-binding transcriptional regulator [Burkholderiales bacterium]